MEFLTFTRQAATAVTLLTAVASCAVPGMRGVSSAFTPGASTPFYQLPITGQAGQQSVALQEIPESVYVPTPYNPNQPLPAPVQTQPTQPVQQQPIQQFPVQQQPIQQLPIQTQPIQQQPVQQQPVAPAPQQTVATQTQDGLQPGYVKSIVQESVTTVYGPISDSGYALPAVPSQYTQWPNRRERVYYKGSQRAGTIEIDPYAKFLYYVFSDGTAWRYPIAVGRAGLALDMTTTVRQKKKWPSWTPTANMVTTQPEVYGPFKNGVPGGLASPLGARALYLYRGGRDTFFRIHGTNDLSSIGNSGSAGCIRLFNHDIIHLYERVQVPTRVTIRSFAESQRIEGAGMSPRGRELPPVIISPETVYGATTVDFR